MAIEKKYYPDVKIELNTLPLRNHALLKNMNYDSSFNQYAKSLIEDYKSGKTLKKSIDEFVISVIKPHILSIEVLKPSNQKGKEREAYEKIKNSLNVESIGLTTEQILDLRENVLIVAEYAKEILGSGEAYAYVKTDIDKVLKTYA